jgi:phage terminase large subunit-like protein
VQFIEGLPHTKGRWAGVKFKLADWQREEIIEPLFGTLNADGKRQYRTAYLEVGRKNGKSELAAAIALKLLVADGEQGAEIYGAAADRDQATIVFHLNERLKIIDSQKRIVDAKSGSVYRAIPADAAGSHGFNASGVIFDEVHAQPSRELWDVLTTSTSAREQPLVFAITTAGYDRTSICWELHDYARKVLEGVVCDPTFFAWIRALPEDADWTDERLWKLANPGLGDFRSVDELRDMVNRAKETPGLQNTVRRLYFSQWTQSESRWFDMARWRDCGGVIGDLAGQSCYGGLDLSSTGDFTSWVMVFDDNKVIARSYLPEAAVKKRSPMRTQLEVWVREGWLTVTPGDVIDYDFIKAQILKDADTYDIREIGFDPWSAAQISVQLAAEGLVMVPVRQGFATMSAPAKLLETLVARGELNHGGNPILTWMADNCVIETDAGANIKPSKKRSTEKIDGIAALVTALERAMHAEAAPEVTFYSFG